MRICKWVIPVLALPLFYSCGEEELEIPQENFVPITKDESSDLNQIWIKEEKFLIDQFVKNEGWEMKSSESGLRYMIYELGADSSRFAKPRDVVWVEFTVAPLGDTIVYASEEGVAESFLVEMDHVENGLHEGITYMKVGDRAKMILPQHLAHGLLGDQSKIPPLTAVVYDIKLVAIE